MAHSYQSGIGGSLTLAIGTGGSTLDVRKWTLKGENKTPETPNTGSSFMTRIAGQSDWSVECEAYWDLNQVPTDPLKDSILLGKTGTWTGAIGNTGKSHSGPVIVSDFTVLNDVEDKVGFTFTLKGNGTLVSPVT